jgi:hypothetical protein
MDDDVERQHGWHKAVVAMAHQLRESNRNLSNRQAFSKARKKFAHLPASERRRRIDEQIEKYQRERKLGESKT